MALVDYLRAQVSCALSLSNLLIMLLNLILSSERCKLDFAQTNLSAMARQVRRYSCVADERPDREHEIYTYLLFTICILEVQVVVRFTTQTILAIVTWHGDIKVLLLH